MLYLKCPACGERVRSVVIDSRLGGVEGDRIRRRRECVNCDARYTTYEKISLTDRDREEMRARLSTIITGLLGRVEELKQFVLTQEV